MKKIREGKIDMPTVRIMKIFSWLISIGGIAAGIGIVISQFTQRGIALGATIIISCLVASLVLRILGVIGQILFNTQALLWETQEFLHKRLNELQTQSDNIAGAVSGTRKQLEVLNTSLCSGPDTMVQATQRLSKDTDIIQQQCLQISCDSKDLNSNINQIKEFFSQIAKRLDINE